MSLEQLLEIEQFDEVGNVRVTLWILCEQLPDSRSYQRMSFSFIGGMKLNFTDEFVQYWRKRQIGETTRIQENLRGNQPASAGM